VLFKEGNILLQNVGSDALMVKASNPVEGMIVNFDNAVDTMAQEISDLGPSVYTINGRPSPFLSVDLLSTHIPKYIYYRHDLESFLYLLTTLIVRYASGRQIEEGSAQLDKWASGPLSDIERSKRQFLAEPNVLFASQFKDLKGKWVVKIAEAFHKGYIRKDEARLRGDAAFDDETLGGSVSYESLSKIIQV
jgi:hypothetical protein